MPVGKLQKEILLKRFKAKVVLVTGGSTGIGQAIAVEFAREGATVIICSRKESSITLQMIEDIGGKAHFIQCDVSRVDNIKKMFSEIKNSYGRLDIAVNNAGVGTVTSFEKTTEQEFDHIAGICFKGVFFCMKEEIIAMKRSGGGAIVNIASTAGVRSTSASAVYVGSKHGVVGESKKAAMEYARDNIRINVICPGATKTPIMEPYITETYAQKIPMGRVADPREIAMPSLFLCSPDASYITGAVVMVDGGNTAQ